MTEPAAAPQETETETESLGIFPFPWIGNFFRQVFWPGEKAKPAAPAADLPRTVKFKKKGKSKAPAAAATIAAAPAATPAAEAAK